MIVSSRIPAASSPSFKSTLLSTSASLAVAAALAMSSSAAEAQACALPGNPAATLCTVNGTALSNPGTFTNAGTGTVVIDGVGTFNNSGTYENQVGATTLVFDNGTTFNNSGTYNNASTAVTNVSFGATFNNTGVYNNLTGGVTNVTNGATFNNFGTVNNGPLAIFDVGGGTINNFGTFNDRAVLYSASGLGPVTFNNMAGGVFNGGQSIGLSGGTFTNDGTFVVRGVLGGPVGDTTIGGGNFVQNAGGTLVVRADGSTGLADILRSTGTITLEGTIVVNYIGAGAATQTFTIVQANGGIINNGVTLANSAVVQQQLLAPDGFTLQVQSTVNFVGNMGGMGMSPNQMAVANNLNQVFAGGTLLGFMPALMGLPDKAQLANALSQLAPLGDGASFASAMATTGLFANQLIGCRVRGPAQTASVKDEMADHRQVLRDDSCHWVRVDARGYRDDGKRDGVGFHETGTMISAGGQIRLRGDWRLGGAIGYEHAELSTRSSASVETERLHLGGVVSYNPGNWLFSGTVTGGFGWSESARHVAFGGFSSTARADTEHSFISGRLTAAHTFNFGGHYLRPQLDLSATHLEHSGYRETATGGIALRVAGTDATVLALSPSVELGTERRLDGGAMVRAYIKGGATFRDNDRFITTAAFADAPGAPSFSISTHIDRITADIGAGVEFFGTGSTSLRIHYDGNIGEHTQHHSGGARLGFKF